MLLKQLRPRPQPLPATDSPSATLQRRSTTGQVGGDTEVAHHPPWPAWHSVKQDVYCCSLLLTPATGFSMCGGTPAPAAVVSAAPCSCGSGPEHQPTMSGVLRWRTGLQALHIPDTVLTWCGQSPGLLRLGVVWPHHRAQAPWETCSLQRGSKGVTFTWQGLSR